MTWCNGDKDDGFITTTTRNLPLNEETNEKQKETRIETCPSCGVRIQSQEQSGIQDLPGLPAGVKFDPTDQELLEHLEGKVRSDVQNLHPLIDEFIPTLEGENGICYTHPEKLPEYKQGQIKNSTGLERSPREATKSYTKIGIEDLDYRRLEKPTNLQGVSKDGLIRHFFHRPSKAYTTGTRKRRKVLTDAEGGETRWHKTGKTRPVFVGGNSKGYKKILVLYTNYGKKRKPEKTNWVMHQYHLGNNEEEKDGELVVSKVFYQTQPRQCGSIVKDTFPMIGKSCHGHEDPSVKDTSLVDYYNSSIIGYDQGGHSKVNQQELIPNFMVHGGSGGSSFLP